MAKVEAEVQADGGQEVHEGVKDYYGKRVTKSDDLMTSCCTVDRNAYSTEAKEAMKLIHTEVLSKYNHDLLN